MFSQVSVCPWGCGRRGVGFPECIAGHMTGIQMESAVRGVCIQGSAYRGGCIWRVLPTRVVCLRGVDFPACIKGYKTSIGGGVCILEGSAHGVSASGTGGGGGLRRPPGTRKADGTHPTGMLSCLIWYLQTKTEVTIK